jgi:hypothetical protein
MPVGNSAKLFQPVDQALDPIVFSIGVAVKAWVNPFVTLGRDDRPVGNLARELTEPVFL